MGNEIQDGPRNAEQQGVFHTNDEQSATLSKSHSQHFGKQPNDKAVYHKPGARHVVVNMRGNSPAKSETKNLMMRLR
jgi:hypothetical protein